MFEERRLEIVRRQAVLVVRSRQLRADFAQDALALQRPFAVADRIRDGFNWIAAHPQWIAAAAIAPLLLRPKKLAGWALKGWTWWRIWRRTQRLLRFL